MILVFVFEDKLFTVHADVVINILTDIKLIDSEHMWDRILENDQS